MGEDFERSLVFYVHSEEMNVKLKRLLSISLFALALSGCGGVPETKVSVPPTAIEANVRKTLEDYEKSGKLGSNISGLQSDINGIKASNSAKGEALLADYRELQTMTDPAMIKAKAKEMLGRL